MRGRHYILAGGGSGGHLYPGLAVAEALRQIESDARVLFLATERAIDATILQNLGWPWVTQPIGPLPGRRLRGWWDFWRRWRASIGLCTRLMKEERPAVVLGLGGFASGAALKVAARRGIPAAMLNPDAVPGKANRFAAKYASRVFLQWQASKRHFPAGEEKCQVTGCPIRPSFGAVSRDEGRGLFGLDPARRTLLVVGGSQGGHNLNAAVVRCLGAHEQQDGPDRHRDTAAVLRKGWQALHLTGERDREGVEREYAQAGTPAKVLAFTPRMDAALAAADLVIGRAGASTLAELTAVGVPSILLPYPYHRDQHQLRNAQVLAEVGAALVVKDTCQVESTATGLMAALEECLTNEKLDKMGKAAKMIGCPDAARRVAEELIKLAKIGH